LSFQKNAHHIPATINQKNHILLAKTANSHLIPNLSKAKSINHSFVFSLSLSLLSSFFESLHQNIQDNNLYQVYPINQTQSHNNAAEPLFSFAHATGSLDKPSFIFSNSFFKVAGFCGICLVLCC
jgi:energy-converting hydrogenase Eha subunit F